MKEWDIGHPLVNGKPTSMRAYATMKGIPTHTFHAYARPDKENQKRLGGQVGRKRLINETQSELLCQVAICSDRANTGLTPSQLQSKIQCLVPGISTEQARNHHRTFKRRHHGRLKERAVKAQKTSSRRSQCTVAQQYRWFQTRDRA